MKNKRPDVSSVCATLDLRHKFNSRRLDENMTGMGIICRLLALEAVVEELSGISAGHAFVL